MAESKVRCWELPNARGTWQAEPETARRLFAALQDAGFVCELFEDGTNLDGDQFATVCDRWLAPQDWPSTLALATARGGEGWSRWTSGTGGLRAAEVLEALLHRVEYEETRCA